MSELTALREENLRLRDKLLEIANECEACGGTGVVTVVHDEDDEAELREETCGDCADIREVLA